METIEVQRFEPTGAKRPRSLLIAHDLFRNVKSAEVLGRELAEVHGFEVLALGLPGHGESTCHKGELDLYNFEDYVGPIARRLERIDPRPVVITHGAASLFLCRILEQRTERAFNVGELPGAIFLGPLGPAGLGPLAAGLRRRHPIKGRLAALKHTIHRWPQTPAQAAGLFLPPDHQQDESAYFATVGPESKRVVEALVGGARLLPLYQQIRARVLVGELSLVCPPEATRSFADFVGAPLEIQPGEAHDLLNCKDVQGLAGVLATWIESL